MADTIIWREWSVSAFAEASIGNKPILLSLVTAWSEECSAMDATTFAAPDVVTLVDGGCVAIRVDADRRPDVSERYNLGGWPTTVLLTPEGQTLSGGTYMGADQMQAWLKQVIGVWRDRGAELRSRARSARDVSSPSIDVPRPSIDVRRADLQVGPQVPEAAPDEAAPGWLRALLIDQFDATCGGFGSGSKFPHPHALTFALGLAAEDADADLKDIVEVTLDRMGALWDPANGGFYRYAGARDWSHSATEKTLEDNAALLAVYMDAAIRLQSEDYRTRAVDLVRWVRSTLADRTDGGFHNSQAAVSREIDRSMYVDRNADMAAQFLRAAVLFDDPWLRDFALKSLETVILPGYTPGAGVAHEYAPSNRHRDVEPTFSSAESAVEPTFRSAHSPPVRGLLGDQVRAAAALIWAHRVTGQLPYSMLALELVQYAVRTMWDDGAGCFRDRVNDAPMLGLLQEPVRPFMLNCEAACVLGRLATLTDDESHRDRALSILRCFSSEYRRHGLFGAPYALAVREVIQRRPPLGLELSHVDWHLDED